MPIHLLMKKLVVGDFRVSNHATLTLPFECHSLYPTVGHCVPVRKQLQISLVN